MLATWIELEHCYAASFATVDDDHNACHLDRVRELLCSKLCYLDDATILCTWIWELSTVMAAALLRKIMYSNACHWMELSTVLQQAFANCR